MDARYRCNSRKQSKEQLSKNALRHGQNLIETQSGLEKGPDNKQRCWWCLGSADYLTYHDNDWGYPVTDDFRLFEKLSLEGFQAGLSWLTILRKRENFWRPFADFEYPVIAR